MFELLTVTSFLNFFSFCVQVHLIFFYSRFFHFRGVQTICRNDANVLRNNIILYYL